MLKSISLVASLALAFLGASTIFASADATLLAKNDKWQIISIVNPDNTTTCGLATVDPIDDTDILFTTSYHAPTVLMLINKTWSLPIPTDYETTIRTGDVAGVDLKGYALSPTTIAFPITTDKEYKDLVPGLFNGSYLTIPVEGKAFALSLHGNLSLADAWNKCAQSLK